MLAIYGGGGKEKLKKESKRKSLHSMNIYLVFENENKTYCEINIA